MCTNASFRVLCSGLVEILGQLGPENEDTMILLKPVNCLTNDTRVTTSRSHARLWILRFNILKIKCLVNLDIHGFIFNTIIYQTFLYLAFLLVWWVQKLISELNGPRYINHSWTKRAFYSRHGQLVLLKCCHHLLHQMASHPWLTIQTNDCIISQVVAFYTIKISQSNIAISFMPIASTNNNFEVKTFRTYWLHTQNTDTRVAQVSSVDN